MLNFDFRSPTRIRFGKGSIEGLQELLAPHRRPLFLWGRGSIKKNGIHDQVVAALGELDFVEFSGIEANPSYERCLEAVERVRGEGCDFILPVGGGSVFDAAKFIAMAARYEGDDPWEVLSSGAPVNAALPLGGVLTLPATGSEMNANSVISRRSSEEKLFFASPEVIPRFSILDPESCYSLPWRQTANGIVDAWVHVIEQYLAAGGRGLLQERQAEAILLTLLEVAPMVEERPDDYLGRATMMWCASNALNGLIGCGVPQDWATHRIGHELTAFYGIDHARSLAIVLPGLLRHQKVLKRKKLLQYAERIWGITEGSEEERIEEAISETESFFRALGLETRLGDADIPLEAAERIARRFEERGARLGEREQILPKHVKEILESRA